MNVFPFTSEESVRNLTPATKEEILTPREREVLGYLASGASNKEIAAALGVKVVTIKLHVRGICRKLHAKNRTQAALQASSLGILPKT